MVGQMQIRFLIMNGQPKQAWILWQHTLACCFCGGYLAHGLLHSLGQWIDRAPTDWQWWYSLQEERIYRYLDSNWHFYLVRQIGQRTRSQRFIYGGIAEIHEIPTRLRRATVSWRGDGILQLTGYSDPEPDHTPSDQILHTTLTQRIQNCPKGMQWAVVRFAILDDGATLAEAIRRGQAIAVSDGSYKDGFGTAAYVLEGATSMHRLVAVLVVPGIIVDQSSYPSKLVGLYGVVFMVHLICEQYGITDGAIEVGCDCQSALRHVFTSGQQFDATITQADYDLLSAIWKMISTSPIKWTCCYVAGHQDDGITVLDRWAQLNVEMNSLAKVYWEDMCDQHQMETFLSHMSIGRHLYVVKKNLLGWMNAFGSIFWAVSNVSIGNGREG
jgi:hypothetical protein